MSGSTPTDVATLTTDPAVALAMMGASTRVVRDDFAGPGGWSTGIADLLKAAGLTEVALEWDASACATRIANGHANTIRADVATYPVEPFLGRTVGYIGSPPCQTFSSAGNGSGRRHLDELAEEVTAILLGLSTYDEAMVRLKELGALDDKDGNPDPRNGLILVPARTIRALLDHPDGTALEWVALEQVPTAGRVFDAYAAALRALGASAISVELCAADYGVPQTRRRRFVLASFTRTIGVPEPSHVEGGEGDTLLGPGRPAWPAMAPALGWPTDVDAFYCNNTAQPNQSRRAVATEPATTVTGGHDYSTRSFVPATLEAERFLVERVGGDGTIRVTEAEGGVLQGFPADYAWAGGRSKRWEQIGNVVCPPVARRIVAELLAVEAEPLPWHRYAWDEAPVPFG